MYAYSLTQSNLPNSSATPWTVAHQAPLSMGFPRGEPTSPAFTGRFFFLFFFFTTEPAGKLLSCSKYEKK